MIQTLDEIAILHGTDKATIHPVKGHGYTPHYAKHFEPLRDAPLKVLEIGVGGGESIKTWLDYFSQAKIWGLDVVRDTNSWNTKGLEAYRYTYVHGDQSDPTMWQCFLADHGGKWDIVIDDGGHSSQQIITSFNALWPQLAPGGFYCIEDLATCYGGEFFCPKNWPNHMDFILATMHEINQGTRDTRSLYFAQELAIFQKSIT